MTILALDGARSGFSCAVVRNDETLAHETIDAKSALEEGLGAVARVLSGSGITAAELERIGVGIGPGSFTGVRIAISYAKSLALAWHLPLSGVNTFDALEAGAALDGALLTVVRGRTGVVSVRYRAGRNAEPWRASGYVRDVLERLPGEPRAIQVLGDAKDVREGLAERGWSVQEIAPCLEPLAAAVAAVAAARPPAESAHAVRADYGELPAARVPKL